MKFAMLTLACLSLVACQPTGTKGERANGGNAPHVNGGDGTRADHATTTPAPVPKGDWEAASKGAIVMGDVTIGPDHMTFAHAGRAALTPRETYVSIAWDRPSRPEIPQCVGGELPAAAQVAVKEEGGQRTLEIAFFRGKAEPAAHRDTDPALCQIQYWSGTASGASAK